MLGGAKRILGCSSRTRNEAVRGDMGLESYFVEISPEVVR